MSERTEAKPRIQASRQSLYDLDYHELLEWRLNEIFPNVEKVNAKPFEVRAHHVQYLANLATGQSPYSLAQAITENIIRTKPKKDAYYQDTIGETPRDRYIFETMYQAFFERYIRLYPHSNVKTVNQKDDLCKSCKIGTHCEFSESFWRVEDRLSEGQCVANLIVAMKSLGLEKEFTAEKEELEPINIFGYTPPLFTLQLTTTREILDYTLSNTPRLRKSLEFGITKEQYLEIINSIV